MSDQTDLEPAQLYVNRVGGDPDQPTLVLLHGLGGTGAVWDRVVAEAGWPGEVVVPDLTGHGASPWATHYSFGAMAGNVASLLGQRRRAVVVGHSMGGAVALALASGWFNVDVEAVMSIGIKVEWSDDELADMQRIADKPARLFDERTGAIEWAAKLAGLFGVVELDDPTLDRAAVETPDGWRAALDPRAGLVGPPPLDSLHAALGSALVLHTLGEHDAMVDEATARRMGQPVQVFADAGHNAMVEQPALVAEAIRQLSR
ncbi:MAG: alpha/beta hydrolase [Actinomycetota bacterium]|nr:alpha/beta hydrolase [Actinomycetota bacterium]